MAPTGRRSTFAIASAAPASCISRCYRVLRCGSRAARWTLRWSAHWWRSCSNERCGLDRGGFAAPAARRLVLVALAIPLRCGAVAFFKFLTAAAGAEFVAADLRRVALDRFWSGFVILVRVELLRLALRPRHRPE